MAAANPPGPVIDANEIYAQLQYLQQLYSQQYEALENDVATYTIANTSLQRNIELLEKAKSIENSSIIISGEGGAYIPAKLSKADKIMTYIGAGYLVEKSLEDSTAFLKANQKKSEEFLNRLMADKQRIERELMDIAFKMNALRAQQGQQ